MQNRMYGKRNDEIVRDFFGPALTDEKYSGMALRRKPFTANGYCRTLSRRWYPAYASSSTATRDLPAAVATNAKPPTSISSCAKPVCVSTFG